MNRTFLFLLAATAGCHAVTIRVERGSSGAVERDDKFEPKYDRNKRFISMPPSGLVDCMDLLTETFGPTPCTESPDGHRRSIALAAAESARGLAPTGDYRAEAVAAFIHVSDGQIREPEAKLGGNDVSSTLDPLVQSFEHDYEQELFSGFVYRAVIETINAEVGRLAVKRTERWDAHLTNDRRDEVVPAAVIHTGDAVDAGLESEFDDFLRISDELEIPWYQVVGNHDLLAFGNLQLVPKLQQSQASKCHGDAWNDIACTCTPISSLVREYILRRPDNHGCENDEVPSKPFTAIPVVLESVCVVHRVRADHFVMDPYPRKKYGPDGKIENDGSRIRTSLGAFAARHCRDARCDVVHLGDRASTKPGWPAYPVRAAEPAPPSPTTQPGFRWLRFAPEADEISPLDLGCGLAAPGSARPRSELNGFDLTWFEAERVLERPVHAKTLAKSNRLGTWTGPLGYYCFELEQEPGSSFAKTGKKVWVFVLNTSTPHGAYGAIDRRQLAWLERRIDAIRDTSAGDLVTVFAHHPIWGIYDADERATLLRILGKHDNMVGYFAGHTHDSQLRVVHPPGGHRFWEVVAPSTLVFPQQARMVQVKLVEPTDPAAAGRESNLAYFDVIPFSPIAHGESGALLERAMEGAKRDQCQQNPASCEAGRPKPPPREVTFPRLYFRLPGYTAKDKVVDVAKMKCRDGWHAPSWHVDATDLAPAKAP